jgi:hypothetical protein
MSPVNPKRALVGFIGLAAFALAITACGAASRQQTSTPQPSRLPGASATSLFPSRTPTITGTSTSTPTPLPPSPTPTITGIFLNASVYGVGRLSGHRLLVSITIPGADAYPATLNQGYSAVVGPSTLPCEVIAQYPDRLYCSGPDPYVNYEPEAAVLALYADGQAGPVFVTEFTIPALPTLTPTPSETPEPSPTP